jgi:hypothetical protein
MFHISRPSSLPDRSARTRSSYCSPFWTDSSCAWQTLRWGSHQPPRLGMGDGMALGAEVAEAADAVDSAGAVDAVGEPCWLSLAC